MLVKDLVKLCYGEIKIYMAILDSDSYAYTFKALYQGTQENVPFELLDCTIKTVGSYEKGVVSICVSGD